MNNSFYNGPDVYVMFQEYIPGMPPGPATKGKILGQGMEYEVEIVTDIDSEAVPAVTTSYSGGGTSTAAAHTITHTITKNIAKSFTVFYCYSTDGAIKKVLPEHITFLNYKST